MAFEPFRLPNGTSLKNRVAKAAMEEKMADPKKRCQPTPELIKLYRAWGQGGSGLILSGHVMIDPLAMASPADVLLSEDMFQQAPDSPSAAVTLDEPLWREWINAAKIDGAQFWLQLNHPGRQIMKGSGLPVYSASAVPMKMGAVAGAMFTTPIAMTEDHILDVIRRFAWTARRAEELGVDGVEIHAAHGYLVSQFLSPLTNKRTDRWGGSLENRARLLFEVIKAVRAQVSPKFGVGVKINTADFQRGGFDVDDLYWVVQQLDALGNVDLIEVSGGNYESPVMSTGSSSASPTTTSTAEKPVSSSSSLSSSTAQREAYFLDAAKRIRSIGSIPIMVTGGITHRSTLLDVLNSSDRFIAGIGTSLGLVPDLPLRWSGQKAAGEEDDDDDAETLAPNVATSSWVLPKSIFAAARIACVQYNLMRVGDGKATWAAVPPLWAFLVCAVCEMKAMGVYKGWMGGVTSKVKVA